MKFFDKQKYRNVFSCTHTMYMIYRWNCQTMKEQRKNERQTERKVESERDAGKLYEKESNVDDENETEKGKKMEDCK